jgi:murein DD-endopeptidase MepM/ murein hydrolase activator NlpD
MTLNFLNSRKTKMKKLIAGLFPQLDIEDFVYVDMEEMAKELKAADPEINLLDQELLAQKLKEKCNGKPYCYGGYLEDRKTLWQGHYMTEGNTIHYGLDITVPVGTDVYFPEYAKTIGFEFDNDQDGGWGSKLTLYSNGVVVTIGHLDFKDYGARARYLAGDMLGKVADTSCNGGWWPHVHIQCSVGENDMLDGYGPPDNSEILQPDAFLTPESESECQPLGNTASDIN